MSKRRRSYAKRARSDWSPDEGIGVYKGEDTRQGFIVLNTPYRRLVFFAGLTSLVALLIATAVIA